MLKSKDEEKERQERLEESYERLFGKIGRDFVTKDDLDALVSRLVFHLDKLLPGFSLDVDDSKAVKRGKEYKENIEKGKKLRKRYKDIVTIDDEEEE